VDSADRLLSHCPGNLDGAIRRHTDRLRVEYGLGKKVEEVDAEGICFTDGSALESDITLWSGGAAPNPFLAQAHLTDAPGRWADVNGTFQSRQRENVFIIGDAAQPQGMELSKQAFHAIDMGKAAAQNVERLLAGKALRDFTPSSKPQVVTFGDLDTFMVFRDFALSSGVLGAAKEAIYTMGLWQLAPPKNAKDLLHSLDLLQKSVRRVYLPTVNPFSLLDKLPKSKVLS
jgi:NADH dehydrogenase FAD-containing subunit